MQRTLRFLVAPAILALALAALGGPVVQAQSAPPGAFCAVLTPEEIQTALGAPEPVPPSEFGGDTSCDWFLLLDSGESWLLSARHDPQQIAELTGIAGSTEIQVAGQRALWWESLNSMYVDRPEGGMLQLSLISGEPASGGAQAALTSLAELALPRMATMALPTPIPPEPAPSFFGDAELQAIFPTEIGGKPVTVQTLSGADLVAQSDPNDPEDQAQRQQLEALLAAQGRTIDDVSVGFGFSFEPPPYGISAVRVKGGDIAPFVPQLLPLLTTGMDNPQQTEGQVAGKTVTVLTSGATTAYAYPRNDVLWVVTAEEPVLTEIFQKLP
jgi:hypothetical protein